MLVHVKEHTVSFYSRDAIGYDNSATFSVITLVHKQNTGVKVHNTELPSYVHADQLMKSTMTAIIIVAA